jgi:hypothetical protein
LKDEIEKKKIKRKERLNYWRVKLKNQLKKT